MTEIRCRNILLKILEKIEVSSANILHEQRIQSGKLFM